MKTTDSGYTINVRGKLLSLASPQVMGILNVTPDSFYAASRQHDEDEVARRADEIVGEGGAIIDVGAYSTRPGAAMVSEAEEMCRLRMALGVVSHRHPDAVVSVDTFRPDVARMAVEDYGAAIINDVSEGGRAIGADKPLSEREEIPAMFGMVARLRVPYVLTSVRPTLDEMLLALSADVNLLHSLGVSDILIDPGFGFGKDLAQNYRLMSQLDRLLALDLPLLVGVSRKSMLWRLLGSTPEETLHATTAMHAVALMKGASVLRVHDVAAAVQACRVVEEVRSYER
ncbi:MAG: dihydropteroate synthase [Prevotella sp.]|nr:dihydropteroate synthase [Prevotella sp.]